MPGCRVQGIAGWPRWLGWIARRSRRYVDAAVAAGLDREGGVEQLTDELIGAVVAAVRPDRPQGHGAAWEALCANRARIEGWVNEGLTVVKIGRSVWPVKACWCRSAPCTATASSAPSIGAGAVARRCRWPTASPGWSVRSISPGWG